jgi:hypothetical protein
MVFVDIPPAEFGLAGIVRGPAIGEEANGGFEAWGESHEDPGVLKLPSPSGSSGDAGFTVGAGTTNVPPHDGHLARLPANSGFA